ncbi:MAG: T9SS type A sorting domain-containing protein, partial [Bacteroidota bacterium]
ISYSLPQNKSGWLEIFNSDGKIIYNLSLPPWSSLQHIDLPYYSSGIYMWKIKSDDMQKFGKLIIIK